jgi:GH18 family chitinase
VLLLQDIRARFDASGRKFGISFTAPTSYWYLRWFDIKKLSEIADWVNVMSYDLHGEWDRNNPIGSIVQAHTNLTEIQYALELFWYDTFDLHRTHAHTLPGAMMFHPVSLFLALVSMVDHFN